MSKTNVKSKLSFEFEMLELRTRHPFGISYGSSSVSKSILLKMKYQDIEGLGEACPASYHNESAATVMAVLEQIQEKDLLGDDPFAIEAICRRLDKEIGGNYAAKSAIEMALQDICGKLLGKPLYQILGLSGLEAPLSDFTIGIDSLEILERKTREAVAEGFSILKVKQGTSYDRDIIECLVKNAPNAALRVDANGAWTPKQAIEMSEFLAERKVQFIEQPLAKHAPLEDWRYLRRHSRLPIFADESCCRAQDLDRLAGLVDGVVVKLAKTGGISEALRLIHTARSHGLKIMIGCMLETSVGISAAAQLSGLVDYLDLDGAMLLAHDPFEGVSFEAGRLKMSDLPGLGVKPRG